MTDQEFENLKDEIEQKEEELEGLQKQYHTETGYRYYPPFRLNEKSRG